MPTYEANITKSHRGCIKTMPDTIHLAKAPIVEALIDLRVQLPVPFDVTRLNAIHEKTVERYPTKAMIRKFAGQIHLTEQGASQKINMDEPYGNRYTSSDGVFVFQARTDGFTLSRLKPYSDWDDLYSEAKRLWAIYAEVAGVELVTRVAVRYINRMEIPFPISDFAEYLASPPIIPAALPQTLSSFLMRFVMHDELNGISAIVTQALEESPSPIVPIVLDIDVFKEGSYEGKSDECWTVLSTLRDFKNRVFFSSITDKTLELFR